MKKINIFLDMDGVLAEYHPETYLYMHEKGFFKNRPLVPRMGNLYKELLYLSNRTNMSVHILSKVIDTDYVIQEKQEWLDEYFGDEKAKAPDKNKVFFVPLTETKTNYIKKQMELDNSINILLDDFSENLKEWETHGKNFIGVKVLNGLNGTKGSWFSQKKPEIPLNEPLSTTIFKLEELSKEV